ncbi:hypothetical protein LSTR_LSTR005192 [Laodelphax striatellus]|uniref:Uncharacterized protein n=1 Tax=Laodelphax striatellus TaxID=195883 RepID=A0A482XNF0_LAOST|nr:hypothetical protein LSTR_LSTR005192 [Laodelphax striatellus]
MSPCSRERVAVTPRTVTVIVADGAGAHRSGGGAAGGKRCGFAASQPLPPLRNSYGAQRGGATLSAVRRFLRWFARLGQRTVGKPGWPDVAFVPWAEAAALHSDNTGSENVAVLEAQVMEMEGIFPNHLFFIFLMFLLSITLHQLISNNEGPPSQTQLVVVVSGNSPYLLLSLLVWVSPDLFFLFFFCSSSSSS